MAIKHPALLTKQQAAEILGIDRGDVDAYVSQFGLGPMGPVGKLGGFYFKGLIDLVRDYQVIRAAKERELSAAIQQYLSQCPDTSLMVKTLAASVNLDAPQTIEGAYLKQAGITNENNAWGSYE